MCFGFPVLIGIHTSENFRDIAIYIHEDLTLLLIDIINFQPILLTCYQQIDYL